MFLFKVILVQSKEVPLAWRQWEEVPCSKILCHYSVFSNVLIRAAFFGDKAFIIARKPL